MCPDEDHRPAWVPGGGSRSERRVAWCLSFSRVTDILGVYCLVWEVGQSHAPPQSCRSPPLLRLPLPSLCPSRPPRVASSRTEPRLFLTSATACCPVAGPSALGGFSHSSVPRAPLLGRALPLDWWRWLPARRLPERHCGGTPSARAGLVSSSTPTAGRTKGSPESCWEGVFLLSTLDHTSVPLLGRVAGKMSWRVATALFLSSRAQCDSGTRLPSPAGAQKGSVTDPGPHSPASPPSRLSPVLGWGWGALGPH